MKKIFTFLSFLLLSTLAFGQTYSYTFSGNLTPEMALKLDSEVEKMTDIQSAKINFKAERSQGQLIFSLLQSVRKPEGDAEFSIADVKNLFISLGLEPLEFTTLEK